MSVLIETINNGVLVTYETQETKATENQEFYLGLSTENKNIENFSSDLQLKTLEYKNLFVGLSPINKLNIEKNLSYNSIYNCCFNEVSTVILAARWNNPQEVANPKVKIDFIENLIPQNELVAEEVLTVPDEIDGKNIEITLKQIDTKPFSFLYKISLVGGDSETGVLSELQLRIYKEE